MSRAPSAMHVSRVVHKAGGKEYVTWLLRQSYRDGGKVKHRTLANLSALPPETILAVQAALRGGKGGSRGGGKGGGAGDVLADAGGFDIVRTLPHGDVAAVLGTLRKLGLDKLLGAKATRVRELCAALIVRRVLGGRRFESGVAR